MEFIALLCFLIFLLQLWHISLFLNSWSSKPRGEANQSHVTKLITDNQFKKLLTPQPKDAKIIPLRPKKDK